MQLTKSDLCREIKPTTAGMMTFHLKDMFSLFSSQSETILKCPYIMYTKRVISRFHSILKLN